MPYLDPSITYDDALAARGRMACELNTTAALQASRLRVVSDNGTELTSTAIMRWSQDSGVEWHYSAPGKVRLGGYGGQRGYAREAFEDAWQRYLDAPGGAQASPDNISVPPEGESKALQVPHDCKSMVFPHPKVPQAGPRVALCEGEKPSEINTVALVALSSPPW